MDSTLLKDAVHQDNLMSKTGVWQRLFRCANVEHNLNNYQQYISPHLDEEMQHFLEHKPHWFGKAPIHYFAKNFYHYARFGYFIRFLHWISKISHAHPQRLLKATNLKEQQQIFDEEIAPFFEHWLVKWVGNLPLSVFSLGISPQQYQAMKNESEGNLLKLYYERIRHLSSDFPIQDNYFA